MKSLAFATVICMTCMTIVAITLIKSSNVLSETGMSEMPPNHDSDVKIAYEKYLANGDCVSVTQSEKYVNKDKPNWECRKTYRMYITKKGAGEKTEMWTIDYIVNDFTLNLLGKERQGIIVLDVISSENKFYILYTTQIALCVTCVTNDNNQFKAISTTLVRKELHGFGELATGGYLFDLGGDIHVLLEFLIGTQEMWRLEGDKATLLWRLGERELELKRQKEKSGENAPESTTPNENSSPPVEGSPPPPAAGRISPNASNTSRPSATPKATDTGTSSQGGAEGAVAEATPFPWVIVIVVVAAALALGAITTLLLTRAKKTAK